LDRSFTLADRKPLERRGILPITLLVVLGEVATEIYGVSTGFINVSAMLLTWVIQLLMAACSFQLLNASK